MNEWMNELTIGIEIPESVVGTNKLCTLDDVPVGRISSPADGWL